MYFSCLIHSKDRRVFDDGTSEVTGYDQLVKKKLHKSLYLGAGGGAENRKSIPLATFDFSCKGFPQAQTFASPISMRSDSLARGW